MSEPHERAVFDALVGEPDRDFTERLLDRLLAEIDDQSVVTPTPTDHETPSEPELIMLKPNPQPERVSRVRIASAAAALLILVGVGVVMTRSDDTTPGTVASDSGTDASLSPPYQDAADAGDARAVVGVFAQHYRVGDVESALEWISPDLRIWVNVADVESGPSQRPSPSGWLPGMIEFEGALYEREDPGDSTCFGPNADGFVWCTFIEAAESPLAQVGASEITYAARVDSGLIVELHTPSVLEDDMGLERITPLFEARLGDFAASVDVAGSVAECDRAAAVENGRQLQGGTVYDGQCGAFLAGFVSDYLADLDG